MTKEEFANRLREKGHKAEVLDGVVTVMTDGDAREVFAQLCEEAEAAGYDASLAVCRKGGENTLEVAVDTI